MLGHMVCKRSSTGAALRHLNQLRGHPWVIAGGTGSQAENLKEQVFIITSKTQQK